MNISTTTLLNILSPNMNNSIKQSIEKLSVDGKVDITTLVKDKNIQSLISGLFKDIALGAETKDSVSTLLLNNKNSFSFKNLSDDIKILVKFLETQISTSTKKNTIENKILNQINVLKESIVDIKNLDSKMLKENISNSGVFLESKLAKDTISLSSSLEKLVSIIKNQIEQVQSMISKSKVNISPDLKVEIKAAIENLLKDVKVIVSQIENKLTGIKVDISDKIKFDLQNISTIVKTIQAAKTPEQQKILVKNLAISIKQVESSITNLLTRANVENNLGITKNISSDIKSTILQIQDQINSLNGSNEQASKEIKATVEKILSQVEYFQLLSYSSNSNHTYLSFLQDDIEDVDIKFNSSTDDSVSCQINLLLKKQGDLKILLVLDKQYNLNINIGIENIEFKQKIQDNLQKLRVGINNIGLMLQSLNIFDINENSEKLPINQYNTDTNLSFGLDIKA